MQSLLRLAFPPQCVSCGALVEAEFALCGTCWRDTPFITGLTCDLCGVPLPGEAGPEAVHCDDCMTIARPWAHGRAALIYKDNARRLILALKHGDRLDLARPAAQWMTAVAGPLVTEDTLLVPVPAHYRRLLVRRYNQAAVLAQEIGRRLERPVLPDALVRRRPTPVQDGLSRDARFENLDAAITPHPRRAHQLKGRDVLLIDDVMTSGATLAAAADACHAAGAQRVCILVLARVAKDA